MYDSRCVCTLTSHCCPEGGARDLRDCAEVRQCAAWCCQAVVVAAKVSLELLEGQASCSTATVLHEEVLRKRVRSENLSHKTEAVWFIPFVSDLFLWRYAQMGLHCKITHGFVKLYVLYRLNAPKSSMVIWKRRMRKIVYFMKSKFNLWMFTPMGQGW